MRPREEAKPIFDGFLRGHRAKKQSEPKQRQNDEEWRAYSLRDIAGAAYAAERRKYISPGERAELFADYLSGKELPFADESEDLSADESPGLTM